MAPLTTAAAAAATVANNNNSKNRLTHTTYSASLQSKLRIEWKDHSKTSVSIILQKKKKILVKCLTMIIIIVNLLKYKNVSAYIRRLTRGAGGMIPIKGSCSSLLVLAAVMSCVGGWGRRPFSFPCVFKAKAPYSILPYCSCSLQKSKVPLSWHSSRGSTGLRS